MPASRDHAIPAPRHLLPVVDEVTLTPEHVRALAADLLGAVSTALGEEVLAQRFLARLGRSRYPGGPGAARARLARAYNVTSQVKVDGASISAAQVTSLASEFHEIAAMALGLRQGSDAEEAVARHLLAEAWNSWRSKS